VTHGSPVGRVAPTPIGSRLQGLLARPLIGCCGPLSSSLNFVSNTIELVPQVAQRAEDLESADDSADSHP